MTDKSTTVVERLRAYASGLFHASAMSVKPTKPTEVETVQITRREADLIHGALWDASALIETQDAEIQALREALRPFGDVGEYLESETEGFSDEDELELTVEGHKLFEVRVGYFRNARLQTDGGPK